MILKFAFGMRLPAEIICPSHPLNQIYGTARAKSKKAPEVQSFLEAVYSTADAIAP
jgi:hypothetical protein